MRPLICFVLIALFSEPSYAGDKEIEFDMSTGRLEKRPPSFRATDNFLVSFRSVLAPEDTAHLWRMLVVIRNKGAHKLDKPLRFLREPIRDTKAGLLRFSLSRFLEDDLIILSLVDFDPDSAQKRYSEAFQKAKTTGKDTTKLQNQKMNYATYSTKLRYSFQVGRPSIYEIQPFVARTSRGGKIYEGLQLRTLVSPQVTSQELGWSRSEGLKNLLVRFTPSVGASLKGKPRIYFAGVNFQLVSQVHFVTGLAFAEDTTFVGHRTSSFVGISVGADLLSNFSAFFTKFVDVFLDIAKLKQKVQIERGEGSPSGEGEQSGEEDQSEKGNSSGEGSHSDDAKSK